jgi:hypothetical protein
MKSAVTLKQLAVGKKAPAPDQKTGAGAFCALQPPRQGERVTSGPGPVYQPHRGRHLCPWPGGEVCQSPGHGVSRSCGARPGPGAPPCRDAGTGRPGDLLRQPAAAGGPPLRNPVRTHRPVGGRFPSRSRPYLTRRPQGHRPRAVRSPLYQSPAFGGVAGLHSRVICT